MNSEQKPISSVRIQVLPQAVADRIAAGEVIERPASVVKELVENSLDAGATEIQVTLENGGKDLIEVIDNGSGMQPEDLSLCVARHATSKLRQLDDLDHLSTLGFRGEALPSIAAVSDLSLLSKPNAKPNDTQTSDSMEWSNLRIGGSLEKVTFGNFLGSSSGTRIRARGLFQSIPARLKFLKSAASEVTHIREWLERLSLTHAETGFRLLHDQKTILQLRPKSLIDRAREILNSGDTSTKVIEWKQERGPLRISCYWAQGYSFPSSRKIFQVVNGRSIKDKLVQSAILAGFKQSLLPGNFPALVLVLEIPPQQLDVNVHPTKTEVRFLHSGAIYHAIESSLNEMIRSQGMIPEAGALRSKQAEFNASSSNHIGSNSGSINYSWDRFTNSDFQTQHSLQSASPHSLKSASTQLHSLPLLESESLLISGEANLDKNPLHLLPFSRYRGCLFETYLLFELNSEELLLIDQHAAHERVRFEKLKGRYLKKLDNPQSQDLLIPECIHCETEERFKIEEITSILKLLGFDAEIFGETQILFRSIPTEWGTENLKARLASLVERALQTIDSTSKSTSHDPKELLWDERKFETLAMESCRSSIRAGDSLSNIQIQALVEQLRACEHPWNCPHGRPAMVRVRRERMEEWFQRKV